MIQGLNYFYDRQQARFLEQIVRAFSGWQYKTGSRAGLEPTLKMIPCRMATTNRVVANLMRNQSENTLLTVPMITVWQTGLTGRPEDLQNRNHVDTRQVTERGIDPITGSYTNNRGQSFTVERIMPLPFNMAIQVDIWTSNLDQKYQIEEQILTTMWPNFDIQNSDNPLDWTALSTVYFEDITHSSRSIPIGTADEIEVMSFTLRLPIWLSPPAKIKQQNLIEQIVTNITDTAPLAGVISDILAGTPLSQDVVTPGNHHISVDNGEITLFGPKDSEHDDQGNVYSWENLLQLYGVLRPASSQLLLKTSMDIEGLSIVGTVQYDELNPNKLLWQIDPDTLPANTLPPVNAVIDPLRSFPVDGGLPSPTEGDRYLILADIGPSAAWGPITAKYGDIIMFTNGAWAVDFTTGNEIQLVLNIHTGRQLRWNGADWVMAIDGSYGPGYWRIRL